MVVWGCSGGSDAIASVVMVVEVVEVGVVATASSKSSVQGVDAMVAAVEELAVREKMEGPMDSVLELGEMVRGVEAGRALLRRGRPMALAAAAIAAVLAETLLGLWCRLKKNLLKRERLEDGGGDVVEDAMLSVEGGMLF